MSHDAVPGRGPVGVEIPVVLDGDPAFDLRPLTADLDVAFLAAGGLDRPRAAVRGGDLPGTGAADLRHGAPGERYLRAPGGSVGGRVDMLAP